MLSPETGCSRRSLCLFEWYTRQHAANEMLNVRKWQGDLCENRRTTKHKGRLYTLPLFHLYFQLWKVHRADINHFLYALHLELQWFQFQPFPSLRVTRHICQALEQSWINRIDEIYCMCFTKGAWEKQWSNFPTRFVGRVTGMPSFILSFKDNDNSHDACKCRSGAEYTNTQWEAESLIFLANLISLQVSPMLCPSFQYCSDIFFLLRCVLSYCGYISGLQNEFG